MTNLQETKNYNLLPYKIDNNNTIEVTQIEDDVWLTRKQMAQLFDCTTDNISLHLKNIFKSNELNKNSVTEEISTTAKDGKQYNMSYYNLDAIISVGYRVNSKRGVLFRQWATKIIKDRLLQDKDTSLEEHRFYVKLAQMNRYITDLQEEVKEFKNKQKNNIPIIKEIFSILLGNNSVLMNDYDSLKEKLKEQEKKIKKIETKFSNMRRKNVTILTY